MKYRRRIQISGLVNASVCLFAESYCKEDCVITNIRPDKTPIPLEDWTVVTDAENGTYLYAENVNGTVSICMPNKA